MAFLGKISAVVTANTTDFTKKIEGTSKQILDLKRKVGGFQLNLNTKSLDGTLTQLQRFNRTLQEAAKLSASVRLANGFPDLGKLAAQFKAFEDVGKPLTKVKSEIEGLANSVQSRLYPELEKVQKGFQDLYRELGDGRVTEAGKVITTTFEQAASRVDGLTAALTRLSRVSAAAKDIGGLVANLNANNTGASFFQPATQSELQRSLTLRGKAEKLPARLRTGIFADLSVEAEANAQKIEEQVARVGAAVLKAQRNSRFSRTPAGRETLAREQGELDRLTRQQEIINNQLAREIRSAEIKQIISPEADSAVDRLKTKFERLAGELRAINGARFDGVIGSVGTLVDQLNRGEVSARKVSAALDGLSKVRAASEIGASYEDAAERALRSQQERDRSTVQEAAAFQRQQIRQVSAGRFRRLNESVIRSDERISGLEGQRQELVALRDSGRLGDDSAIAQVESQIAAERARRARAAALAARVGSARARSLSTVDVNEQIGIERIGFSDVVARQRDLQQRAESLGIAPLIKEANQLNKTAIDLKRSLSAAFQAAKDDPEAGVASLEKFRAKLYGQIAAYDSLDKKIRTASDAQRQFNLFLAASGGLSDKLDPTLEGVASDIATTKQFRGQYGRDNDLGRVATAERVALAERRVNSLILQRQKIEEAKGLSDEKRAKAFAKNRRLIEAEGQAALDAAADNSGGIFPRSQVNEAATRRRKSTGSFGVAGSAAAQLAVQQGLFAVDDLISSTGGLEYKLRAIGNNITQLGLLVGQSGVIPGLSATTGLAIGLATVIGGQLLSALLRFASGSEAADRRADALNESLAKQKSLAEQVANAFRSIGDSTISSAFSAGTKDARDFAKSLADLEKEQAKSRKEMIAGIDPAVVRERASQEQINKRLQSESNVGRRVQLERDRRDSQRRERAAIDAAVARPAPTGEEAAQAIARSAQREFAAATALMDPAAPPDVNFTARRDAQFSRAADARRAEGDPFELLKILRAQQSELRAGGLGDGFFGSPGVADSIAELETLIRSLEAPLREAADSLSRDFLSGAKAASLGIGRALDSIADSINNGVPGAGLVQDSLERIASKIQAAQDSVEKALEDGLDPEEIKAVVEKSESEIAGLRLERERKQATAAAAAFDAIVNPSRLLPNVVDDASQRISAAGFSSGSAGGQERLLRAQIAESRAFLDSRRGRDGLVDPLSLRIFEAWNAELVKSAESLARTASALQAFADKVEDASRSVDSDASSALQRADQARRTDIRLGTPETRRRREVAEEQARNAARARSEFELQRQAAADRINQQAINDRPIVERLQVARRRGELAREIQVANDEIILRAEAAGVEVAPGATFGEISDAVRASGRNDLANEIDLLAASVKANREALGIPREGLWKGVADAARELEAATKAAESTLADEFDRIREIDTILAAPLGGVDENGVAGGNAEQREQLRRERARLQAQVDAAVEQSPEVLGARRRRDELTAEIENADAAARGRELRQTPAQRAAQDVQSGLNDIFRAFAEDATEITGLLDREGLNAAARRFVGEQSRQAAPAIFSLADSVQNAILQGPNRAALNAADVTTTEGARELNRLLRGDDPAKDVNIVELQKQSELLAQISKAAKETAAKMGIVLDFK